MAATWKAVVADAENDLILTHNACSNLQVQACLRTDDALEVCCMTDTGHQLNQIASAMCRQAELLLLGGVKLNDEKHCRS